MSRLLRMLGRIQTEMRVELNVRWHEFEMARRERDACRHTLQAAFARLTEVHRRIDEQQKEETP